MRKACEDTEINYSRFGEDGFIFHDLRHTFNTDMLKAGVPEGVIMQITGHSNMRMFFRYNTVGVEDTKKTIYQMEGFLQADRL